jgi:hypothetical protein
MTVHGGGVFAFTNPELGQGERVSEGVRASELGLAVHSKRTQGHDREVGAHVSQVGRKLVHGGHVSLSANIWWARL